MVLAYVIRLGSNPHTIGDAYNIGAKQDVFEF
jgi:hypothetical protein